MPILRLSFCVALFALSLLPGPSEAPRAASFTRSGADQLEAASLASGESLSFSYDASHGQMTAIAGENGLSLKLESDTLLHLPVSQSVEESGDTLLSAAITYEAGGLRASRIVSAGTQGSGSAITSYWYGGGLHPLVITRDGVTYRLIGKGVVEAIGASGPTRTYLQADHLGSVRMATNDQGHVVQSLSYDDYGFTRIQGQSAAASFDSMASFYRFQGQEQEVFPLAKLSIDDSALAAWLDQLQLYHFPWRDYAAGLAAFTQTDPVPTGDSLYAAFAANPVNYTDETGGMIGENTTDDDHVDSLLDQLLQNRAIRFEPQDRDLLRQRLYHVKTSIQELVSQSEALTDRIAAIGRQVQQTEQDLQRAREEQAYFHLIRLVSEHRARLRQRADLANPVNFTDETGGMWDYPETYTPVHQRIPLEIQELLDVVLDDPHTQLTRRQFDLVSDFWNSFLDQYHNPNNPFRPFAMLYDGLFEFGIQSPPSDEERRRYVDIKFRKLRQEQREFIDRYAIPLATNMREHNPYAVYFEDVERPSRTWQDQDGAIHFEDVPDDEIPNPKSDDDGGIVGLDEQDEIIYLSDEQEEEAAGQPSASPAPVIQFDDWKDEKEEFVDSDEEKQERDEKQEDEEKAELEEKAEHLRAPDHGL